MNKDNLRKLLAGYDPDKVDIYVNYCKDLEDEIDSKTKEKKNKWMHFKTDEILAGYFKKVHLDGMYIDGKHITVQSTGVSYDYVAYKNKMLLVYPETTFDIQMVYKNDQFRFRKESGKVLYTHEIANPFERKEDEIIGGYCVIKNKRGEFLTTLSTEELEKHRKVAKTDSIWSKWLYEMYLKTVAKKACTQHFKDVYQNIETIDNENYDVDLPLDISIETKQELEKISSIQDLEEYYKKNASKNSGIKEAFIKACSVRKEQIVKELSEKSENEDPSQTAK